VQIYRDKESDRCESTLKRIFRDYANEKYILKPINPEHPEMEIDWKTCRLEVVGVYRGLLTTS
jgi:SOS-response transcriptional repressor LexA